MTFLANPFNRALVIAGLALIIAILAFFYMIQPAQQQYDASLATLQQDQQQYADLKRVADQKPEYLALIKQIQSRLRNVEITADPRVYIPSYLKQIEKYATDDGLQVTAVTPQAVPSPSPGASAAPGPIATVNPSISAVAPINSAKAAAGQSNVQTQTTNGVASATGATPIPAPGGTPATLGTPGPGSHVVQQPKPTTARENAIAYLNNSFTQVPVNMEFAGSYDDFEKFLRDLNKFPKLLGVGNVTLTPGGQHNGVGETPTLNIVLPIIAYRLSPNASGAQPAATPAPGNGG